jgi:hypothetical protein
MARMQTTDSSGSWKRTYFAMVRWESLTSNLVDDRLGRG